MLSTAIAATVIYLIHDRLFKPPKNIRHISYVSWIPAFLSSFRGISTFDYNKRNIQPKLESKEIKDIYVVKVGWAVYVTNPLEAKRILMKTGNHSLFFSNGDIWKYQHKLLGPTVGRHSPVQMFGEHTTILLDQIDQLEEAADVKKLLRRYTLDATGRVSFGINLRSTSDPNCELVNTYDILNDAIQDPFHFAFPYFEQNYLWMFPKLVASHEKLKTFRGLIDKMIIDRKNELKQTNCNKQDMLTAMIEAQEKEGIITDKHIRSNIHFSFLAGYTGTANMLCFTLYHLAVNPDIQRRAREEVLSILGNDSKEIQPTLEQIKQMRYVYMTIKEVLRMHPTAPRSIPRIAQEDTVICDKLVPKGSLVAVDVFNMHYHDDVWSQKNEFNPERFGKAEDDGSYTGKGLSWLPFGGGARQCIGMNMSLLFQRIFLCMMLTRYEWMLPEDSIHKNGLITEGAFLVAPTDMRIKFKPRC
ncbi:cytochrome P450 [Blakeslea trispora]|nr:cytochrome P450 [Blakeslea trispora]